MESHFFAMISRMKYIERWALMRNSYSENISEHSLEVSMIAHMLAVLANKRCNRNVDASKAALIGLYHDATEIITGDMPTPIKYYNREIEGAFKLIEENAAHKLFHMIPEDLKEEYEGIFFRQEEDEYVWKLVKAADRISALIKCIEEKKAGNREFEHAQVTILQSIEAMQLEEANLFLEQFIPSFEKTLDELQ